jgi:hypothetical protein
VVPGDTVVPGTQLGRQRHHGVSSSQDLVCCLLLDSETAGGP